MFNSSDPQAYEVCPYNNSHRILKYRMTTHIAKCKKQYEQSEMVICLFNATHSIPANELQHHLQNCPDRFNLDKEVLITRDVDNSKFPIQKIEVEEEESWDDIHHSTYKPDEYCIKNAVLRQTKVESAATRKNFRMEERHRIQKLKEMGPSNTEKVSRAQPASKFRSTALANTTTNVNEPSPYTYEEVERIIQNRNIKPLIVDPNVTPTFVSSSNLVGAHRNGKPMIVGENQIPTFVRSSNPVENQIGDLIPTFVKSMNLVEKTIENQNDTSKTEDATGFSSESSTSSTRNTGAVKKQFNDFIPAKSKKRIGRGRGRGVTH